MACNNILLLGSSIIKKWNSFQFLNKKYVISNKGISGLLTNELLSKKYIEMLYLEPVPKYIILYIGGNDMKHTSGNSYIDYVYLNNSLSNIIIFINILQKIFVNFTIIIISIIKSPHMFEIDKIKYINFFNKRLHQLTNSMKNVHYLDVNKYLENNIRFYNEDKHHLNEYGYIILEKSILCKIHNL